jgi:excisionase family DNA binding protein
MSDLLTVHEAATLAGVSERTVRRWASSGHVRTVVTGHGRRVVAASLPERTVTHGQHDRADRPSAATGAANGHEAGHLAELVRELSDRLAEQAALTAIWQERARVLGDQLALAAPQQPAEAPGAPESPDPTTEPSAPWWRSWWPW